MTFVPENDLESTLMRAASEPAARPAFYSLLLGSDLFVIGDTGQPAASERTKTLQEGGSLRIMSAKRGDQEYLPVFSSLARLNVFIRKEAGFVRLNGKALFEATRGAMFILNPGSEFGKELLPAEIEQLLNPTVPNQIKIEQPTKVLIGQPAIYPQALIDALRETFAKMPDVLSAYLIQIAFPDKNPPHPLIGIETLGDSKRASAEIGRVASQVSPSTLLDVVPIDRSKSGDTLSTALLKTEPFYLRSSNSVQ